MHTDTGEATERVITGHTARRSGAQWMARRGLPLWAVQYLGRWGSGTVRVYTAQAYADHYANFSAQVAAGARAEAERLDLELWAMAEQVKADPGASDRLPAQEVVREVLPQEAVEEAQVPEPAATEHPAPGEGVGHAGYVLCTATGRTHLTAEGWSPSTELVGWRARCGWAFARGNSRLPTGRPTPPFCQKCFRGMELPGEDSEESG